MPATMPPHSLVSRLAGSAAIDAIADYSLSLRYDEIPSAVVEQAKRLLLDGISWMVLGARKEAAQAFVQSHKPVVGRSACTIIGTNYRAVLVDALRCNGALTQVHDCNDGRRLARRDGGSNHPGRCVIPVALTLAQHYQLAGKDLLALIVLGYELAARLQVQAVDQEYSCVTAALLARAGGLTTAATRRALALAYCSFPAHAWWSPDTDFDFLRLGLILGAAADATVCADAALSVPFDRCQVEVTDSFPTAAGDASGYAIMGVYLKPYPCCRALHPVIDAVLAMRRTEKFAIDEVIRIDAQVGNTKPFQFEPVAHDAHYKLCEFSIPYTAACALLDGTVEEQSFTRDRIRQHDVQELQNRVTVTHNPRLQFNPVDPMSHARPALVDVKTRDGRAFSHAVLAPRGSVIAPLTDTERHAKFRAWTTPSYASAQQDHIIAAVAGLEDIPNVAELISQFGTHLPSHS